MKTENNVRNKCYTHTPTRVFAQGEKRWKCAVKCALSHFHSKRDKGESQTFFSSCHKKNRKRFISNSAPHISVLMFELESFSNQRKALQKDHKDNSMLTASLLCIVLTNRLISGKTLKTVVSSQTEPEIHGSSFQRWCGDKLIISVMLDCIIVKLFDFFLP